MFLQTLCTSCHSQFFFFLSDVHYIPTQFLEGDAFLLPDIILIPPDVGTEIPKTPAGTRASGEPGKVKCHTYAHTQTHTHTGLL